jgi:hypothetical protein
MSGDLGYCPKCEQDTIPDARTGLCLWCDTPTVPHEPEPERAHAWAEALHEAGGLTVAFRTLTSGTAGRSWTRSASTSSTATAPPPGCTDHDAVEDRKPLTEEQKEARRAYARDYRKRAREQP